jgi:beta-lactamase superfamily II metal-dependent hydrolase
MPALNGDGNLYITFISMGQGDCVIVSLPNGKTLMADCGTSRWDTEYNRLVNPGQSKADQAKEIRDLRQHVIDVLFEPRFLHARKRIDALVLTHPDKDHCNELASSLQLNKPAITSLYFSNGTLDHYVEGSAGWWLSQTGNVGNAYAVAINQTQKTLNNVTIAPEAAPTVRPAGSKPINVVSVEAATQGFVRILDGTKAGGKNCEVFLLASDVVEYPAVRDNSTPQNRGSVVTMIVFGTKKIMLCGDATFHTEKFLIDTYAAKISDLELLHLPHHGSKTSSSWAQDTDAAIRAIDFVGRVRPHRIVVSAATNSGGSLKLPRHEVIERYIKSPAPRLRAADGSIWSWLFTEAVYDAASATSRKRKTLTSASNDWEERTLAVDIVSTGTIGTTDYVIEDADA